VLAGKREGQGETHVVSRVDESKKEEEGEKLSLLAVTKRATKREEGNY